VMHRPWCATACSHFDPTLAPRYDGGPADSPRRAERTRYLPREGLKFHKGEPRDEEAAPAGFEPSGQPH
jgi:hypothetical protein